MTETEFLAMADDILDKVEDQAESWFENLDLDIDCERSGQVLTLIFNRRDHLVLNSQAPLHEMWLAAPSGAFHYQYKEGTWKDTRGNLDLEDQISKLCSELAEQNLTVTI